MKSIDEILNGFQSTWDSAQPIDISALKLAETGAKKIYLKIVLSLALLLSIGAVSWAVFMNLISLWIKH